MAAGWRNARAVAIGYTPQDDVSDLCELIRLRELLGLSLEELGRVIEAEDARALLRAELEAGVEDPERRRAILTEALGHVELQLSLVQRRANELATLADDLRGRRERLIARLAQTPAGVPDQPARRPRTRALR